MVRLSILQVLTAIVTWNVVGVWSDELAESRSLPFRTRLPDLPTVMIPGRGFKCDFEDQSNRFCGMTQLRTDNFDWSSRRGSTPSQGTGPTTGRGNTGYYMYIEASGQRQGQNATIRTPQLQRGDYYVDFWYHMSGRYIGRLEVWARSGRVPDNWRRVWAKAGNQHIKWQRAIIKVRDITALQFVGVRGIGIRGDIGVDSINLTWIQSQTPSEDKQLPTLTVLDNNILREVLHSDLDLNDDKDFATIVTTLYGFMFTAGQQETVSESPGSDSIAQRREVIPGRIPARLPQGREVIPGREPAPLPQGRVDSPSRRPSGVPGGQQYMSSLTHCCQPTTVSHRPYQLTHADGVTYDVVQGVMSGTETLYQAYHQVTGCTSVPGRNCTIGQTGLTFLVVSGSSPYGISVKMFDVDTHCVCLC